MSTTLLKARGPNAPEQAVRALLEGQLVLLPTETIAGVAALAARTDTLDRLFPSVDPRPALAWHAPSKAELTALLAAAADDAAEPAPLSPIHKRLIDRLTPGPVQLAIELTPPVLTAALKRLRIAPAVIDDDNRLLVRIPSHPAARAVIEATWNAALWADHTSEGAIVLRSAQSLGTPERIASIADTLPHLDSTVELACAVDAPPRPAGTPSTLLVLERAGGYRVARHGAYEERFIINQAQRTILFVCTGNTCRSPMAKAIAQHIIERDHADSPMPTNADSAGVMAADGMPASPEVADALRSLGIEPAPHASKPVTRAMLQNADHIFVLTNSHAHSLLAIEPDAADRIQTLDPQGRDVADPIGGPQHVYNTTAKQIHDAIKAQLSKIDW